MDPTVGGRITAASRYAALEPDRNQYLDRARDCSKLTIPSIMPPAGHTSSSQLPTPYQSLGARGVRNLSSKLLLSLFPTNTPFFQYKVDDVTLEQLAAKRGDVEKALASRERAVVTEIEKATFRPVAFMSLMHLLIVGNALVYLPHGSDERAQVFRLDQYVCRRDPAGSLLELVIKETLDLASLEPTLRAAVEDTDHFRNAATQATADTLTEVDLYTHVELRDGRFEVYQETCGVVLPGTSGSFTKDLCPYFPLRFSGQPGEHYGRSYVEEFLGDLDSLEALSEALVEGSAASAKIVFLVDPAGATSLQVVATARTGDVVSGRAADVQAMQVQKSADLQVARSQAEAIANRVSYAFLLQSSVQRQGERVTAQEIRYMAAELDDGLGGVYTLLSADFQLPALRIFEKRMSKRLKVPALPDTVQPVLVTGLQAIGRGQDQRNLQAFSAEVIQILTPEVAFKYINPSEYIARAATGYGVDPNGLVYSAEEIAAKEQQQQQMMMLQQFGPEVLKQGGGMMQQAMASQGTPQ